VHPEIVRALVKAGADVEVEKGRAERVRAVEGCGVLLCVGWQFASLFPRIPCGLAEVCHACGRDCVCGLVHMAKPCMSVVCIVVCMLVALISSRTLRREDALHFTMQS
jgi:hypothetical protein